MPRAGRGGAAHGRAAGRGGAGRGRAGRDADGPARPGDNRPSRPPGHRRQLSERLFGSTKKGNPMQTDGGTKPAVDPRFIRGR